MPRASTTAKRQQGAANHRDTRHENGLVGPGKPVRKQKSNGHLASQPKPSETPPPLPGTPPTNGHAQPFPPADINTEPKMQGEMVRRTSIGAYSESSSSESYSNPPLIAVSHENHRQIDVNATKNPNVHRDAGLVSLAITIIQSMPLADTIAILIVLLQLPPTLLSIIHILFTLLTFVPASANGELSFSGLLEGSVGTPSIATILVVDGLVLLVWAFLWGPLKDLCLDAAQAVIALTLGGATGGREAGIKNVFLCFGILGLRHHFTGHASPKSRLGASLSSLTKGYLGSPDPDDPLESASRHRNPSGGYFGIIRNIVAIHILTQGGVRCIRDWYVRREKRVTTSLGDPEAAKGLAEAPNDASSSQTPENESTTTLPITNIASSKKKKKQVQQLRIRQPLWAALASTKIVMVKEYETSSAASESAGTNATDINNLGNAPFNSEPDRIWITHIGHDSVVFATSYFPNHSLPADGKCPDYSTADSCKPFYVRVNSSIWQPTRIYPDKSDEQPITGDTRWEGEIPGLTPLSSYACEFISAVDGTVIFSTSVMTLAPKLVDPAAAGVVSKPVAAAGRPGSPNTTLKNSIVSSEKRLAEDKNKQKRDRKEHRAKLASIRKEIEKLNANIASSGGTDEKQLRKIQQSKTHLKQAEEDLEAIVNEIRTLSTTPVVDEAEFRSLKSKFKQEKETHKKLESDFKATRQADEDAIQALAAESSSLQQKKERITTRITKLDGDLERIKDANARGLNEAQRIATNREAIETSRVHMETLLRARLDEITTQTSQIAPALTAAAQQVHSYYQEVLSDQLGSPGNSNLHLAYGDIPEGIIPNSTGYPWPSGPGMGMYGPTGYAPTSMPLNQSPYRRGRSSSMLSNVSGFTQSSGEGPNGYAWAREDRKDSSGSGSISGSGSAGSVGDPKSPGVGTSKPLRWPATSVWDER